MMVESRTIFRPKFMAQRIIIVYYDIILFKGIGKNCDDCDIASVKLDRERNDQAGCKHTKRSVRPFKQYYLEVKLSEPNISSVIPHITGKLCIHKNIASKYNKYD